LKSDVPKQKKKPKGSVKVSWIVTIFFSTILISGLFSTASNMLLGESTLAAAFVILLLIVFIGIFFDVIGVAVTAADSKPFHSMAAHRVRGAQEALKMLKNAEKVSSFCNDVVGDICGVISGTASASIVLLILSDRGTSSGRARMIEIMMAALVSGLTVGGKAVGKTLAMTKSTQIVHMTALVVYYIKSLPGSVQGLFLRKSKGNHK
jgi:Mg2+/Co2+ transporter CorB